MGRQVGPRTVNSPHTTLALNGNPSITLQAMKECMQGSNKEGHNLLDHGCQMILRCQQIYPLDTPIYLSGNHYRSVRKLIGKFFIDRRRVISVNIR